MVPWMAHRWAIDGPWQKGRRTIDGNAMVHRWPMDGLPWDPNSGMHTLIVLSEFLLALLFQGEKKLQ